ncbi:MAG: endonuclease [Flavobacteriaceae bacterium]|nr:endonuclease [Flavobacteriaceae bacterium]
MLQHPNKDTNIYTIAFYNLENLFDTRNNPYTLDDDFTPRGKKNWTDKRYKRKLKKLGRAISYAGFYKSFQTPVIVGVAEVENQKVLRDLTKSKHLRDHDYSIAHFDSSDERGIDVGLLYKADLFDIHETNTIRVDLVDEQGMPDYTRDILYVKGTLLKEEIHLLVNHWPSRRGGSEKTEHKRLTASETLSGKINHLLYENPDANIIVMGDFNDDPHSKSMEQLLEIQQLYNPMQKLFSMNRGSLNHNFHWNLFDQIILTHNFFEYKPNTLSFLHADIFDDEFLREWQGKNKGNPFRTFKGRRYLGGYSDHYPVYIHLKHNI